MTSTVAVRVGHESPSATRTCRLTHRDCQSYELEGGEPATRDVSLPGAGAVGATSDANSMPHFVQKRLPLLKFPQFGQTITPFPSLRGRLLREARLKLEATAGLFDGNIILSCLSVQIKKYGEPGTVIRSARQKFLLYILKRLSLRLGYRKRNLYAGRRLRRSRQFILILHPESAP